MRGKGCLISLRHSSVSRNHFYSLFCQYNPTFPAKRFEGFSTTTFHSLLARYEWSAILLDEDTAEQLCLSAIGDMIFASQLTMSLFFFYVESRLFLCCWGMSRLSCHVVVLSCHVISYHVMSCHLCSLFQRNCRARLFSCVAS